MVNKKNVAPKKSQRNRNPIMTDSQVDRANDTILSGKMCSENQGQPKTNVGEEAIVGLTRALVRWTAMLFLATAVLAIVAMAQWWALKSTDEHVAEQAKTAVEQLKIASGQLNEMEADQRPWIEVVPEINDKIIFSVFSNETHVHVPIKCGVTNFGRSPARNVICMTRIDSQAFVSSNETRATIDKRETDLCENARKISIAGKDAGIPVFQTKPNVAIHQISENIDKTYFTEMSTIYVVQGCVDYTYSADRHGRTAFRYLIGKFGDDHILHGIPFIRGNDNSAGPGHSSQADLSASAIDFIKTDGGNYAE